MQINIPASLPTLDTFNFDSTIVYNPIQNEFLIVYIQQGGNVTSVKGNLLPGNSDIPSAAFTILSSSNALAKPGIAYSDVGDFYYVVVEEHTSMEESHILGIQVSNDGQVPLPPTEISSPTNLVNTEPAITFNSDKNLFAVAIVVGGVNLTLAEVSGNIVLQRVSLHTDFDTVMKPSITYNSFTEEYLVGTDRILNGFTRAHLWLLNGSLVVDESGVFRTWPFSSSFSNQYNGVMATSNSDKYIAWISEEDASHSITVLLVMDSPHLLMAGPRIFSSQFMPEGTRTIQCRAVYNSVGNSYLAVAESTQVNGTSIISFYNSVQVENQLVIESFELSLDDSATTVENPSIAYNTINDQAVVVWDRSNGTGSSIGVRRLCKAQMSSTQLSTAQTSSTEDGATSVESSDDTYLEDSETSVESSSYLEDSETSGSEVKIQGSTDPQSSGFGVNKNLMLGVLLPAVTVITLLTACGVVLYQKRIKAREKAMRLNADSDGSTGRLVA